MDVRTIKREEKKFWDNISEDMSMKRKKEGDARREQILEAFHLIETFRDKFLLEICCGTGENANVIANRAGSTVIGLDISSEAIKIATKNTDKKIMRNSFIVADAENLPFQEDVFDDVFTIYCLHHLSNPEKCIEEMYRVLKPGGNIIIWKESGGLLSKFKNPVTISLNKDFPVCSPIERVAPVSFSIKELYKLFKDAGFSEINVRGAEYVMGIWSIFALAPPKFLFLFIMKLDDFLSHIPFICNICFTIRITAKKKVEK
jgi:SAM-dependent methyltransferase